MNESKKIKVISFDLVLNYKCKKRMSSNTLFQSICLKNNLKQAQAMFLSN